MLLQGKRIVVIGASGALLIFILPPDAKLNLQVLVVLDVVVAANADGRRLVVLRRKAV